MNLSLFAFTGAGVATARRIWEGLRQEEDIVRAYTIPRLAGEGFAPMEGGLTPFVGPHFAQSDALIFVGAAGVAVRAIAPYVRDKKTDPAVVVVDEAGQFAISLLSGHIGGANALCRRVAGVLGATAVITTATDVRGKFSVDTWACRQGLWISDMKVAKAISAAILEKPVGFFSPFPLGSCCTLPNGLCLGETGEIGIALSCEKRSPFATTLHLVPPLLHVGIGCRRGAREEDIARAVEEVFRERGLFAQGVKCVASIDLKAEEEGLLAFCRSRSWPVSFYSAETLSQVPGTFSASKRVEQVTGVDNVCERAAMVGAQRLVVEKTVRHSVTVAVAVEQWEVFF